MQTKTILIGNSDGIGLATTKRLLEIGHDIIGISRSESPVKHERYKHHAINVTDSGYLELLGKIVAEFPVGLCIYFVGVGEMLDPLDMSQEPLIIDVNFTTMVKTASSVIPAMVKRRQGHFIGLSSVADDLLSSVAPSYHASKAGFTNYLRGLALALKPKGVYVTNIRFGFVDTKMAKGDVKPFMMSVEKAVDHIDYCIRKKPVNYTAPKIVIPLIKFRKIMMALGAK